MNIIFYILLVFWALLVFGGFFLYLLEQKIKKFEKNLIQAFIIRTDTIPWLFEISKVHISRHSEIFFQILELRKQESLYKGSWESLEFFKQLESKIHHEINFIFQVCNKNPKLLKEKRFLYLRDVIINKSSYISKQMKIYRKIIEIYNSIIKIKNYSIIWLILPFAKKTAI